MHKISVVMSTYNENPKQLEEAIVSILSQSYTDFEFIIIEDNPNNTVSNDLIARYKKQDPRIRVIHNKRNIGLAASLNAGIQEAYGKYICRMDADDIAFPDRIETQLNYLELHSLDLVGGFVVAVDEKGRDLYSVNNIPLTSTAIKRALKYNNCIPHPTWLGKKDIYMLGYRNIPLCEDYDLLLRACLSGFQLGNVPETILKYRMSSHSLSRSNLFDQYLFQCFISDAYAEGCISDIDRAKAFVAAKATDHRRKQYSVANDLFNKGVSSVSRKQFLPALAYFSKIPFTSNWYLRKVLRLLKSTLSSKIK